MLLILPEVCFGTFFCPAAAPWELNAVRLPAFGQGHFRPASSRCASYQIQPPKTLKTDIFSASAHHILGRGELYSFSEMVGWGFALCSWYFSCRSRRVLAVLKFRFVGFVFAEAEWAVSAVLYIQNNGGIRATDLYLEISCRQKCFLKLHALGW